MSRRVTRAKRLSISSPSIWDDMPGVVQVEPRRWEPEPYMTEAARWMVTRPEAILFLEPGLGKTAITLAALKAMRRGKAVKKALVVAPLRVCYQVWTHDGDGELSKWSDFQELHEVLLHGTEKNDRLDEKGDLYIVNPDGLQWLTSCPECGHPQHHRNRCCPDKRCDCRCKEAAPLEVLMSRGVDTLVVDELSKFKHTATKRFKAMKPYLSKFRRRYGLTGSPAANGLLDLFGQAYTIDLGRALGRYITHYRFKYFMPTGFGGYKWVPKAPDTERQIYAAMKNLALAMKADGRIKVPELVENDLWVDLPPKVRERYDELEEELFTQFDRHEIVAANAAVASGKCRQVASGGLYVGENPKKRKVLRLHDMKTEALVDLVDELQGSPLLVGYEYQHDLERIREALGDVPIIGSGSKPKDTAAIASKWNRGEIPVLVGHPQSMAHGLNLQASGNHVCWYTPTWDYELYDQMNRRVRRQGNTNKTVVVHRIAARKTTDVLVLRSLKAKAKGQNSLFEALQAYRQARRRGAA